MTEADGLITGCIPRLEQPQQREHLRARFQICIRPLPNLDQSGIQLLLLSFILRFLLALIFRSFDSLSADYGIECGWGNKPVDEGLPVISNPSSSSFIDSSLFTVFWLLLLLLFWLLCCKSSSNGGRSSSSLSVRSITSISAAVGWVDEDIAWRSCSAFTRSSARSAFLMVSGVGSKADDLKTCLSLKSTAFLHVGPGSREASDVVKPDKVTAYRVETLSLQQPRILVRVHRHDHCAQVGTKNAGSWGDLQLTVMGNRGAA